MPSPAPKAEDVPKNEGNLESLEQFLKTTSASPWALPILLTIASLVVFIFPERTFGVILALGAILTSPVAAEIFGNFSLDGLSQGAAVVKKPIVAGLVQILDPVMSEALPPALIKSFQDEKMANSMVKMMEHMMANPDFVKVLKNFISTSMTNEELLGSLKEVMRDALSDSHLYKSAMHGVAHSLNPLHSETLGKMFTRKSPRGDKEETSP